RRNRGRRATRRVQPGECAAIPDDGKKIAADAVAARFEDRQGDGGRQRRVDRVAATLKHRDARLRGERLRRRYRVARENGLTPRRVGQCPVEAQRADGIVHADSWNASSRFLRNAGATISSNSSPAITSIASESGPVKNVVGSPRDSNIARRRFSSIIGPSTKPSSSGAGSHSSFRNTTPSSPKTAVWLTSKLVLLIEYKP